MSSATGQGSGRGGSGGDEVATLNEVEAYLRAPDAIMEPDIVDRLRCYVQAQGHPQQAVEFLSDGYQGACVRAQRGDAAGVPWPGAA